MKDLKKIESELGKNIHICLPMIEEITNDKMIPMCVIGSRIKSPKDIQLRFATLSDEHDSIIYQFCQSFVEQYKDKYELNPSQKE